MTKAKLILINGFNASGKTTIAKRYIREHSMAMAIEVDELVDNIGDWASHRDEVQKLTFRLASAMLRAYLPSGHDVVLPYIITNIDEVREFETIAHDCDAAYYEIFLDDEKGDAITKLLKRGNWGETSSPKITDRDMPLIEKDYTNMRAVLEQRPHVIKLSLKGNSPDTTYQQLLQAIEPQSN